MAEGIVPEGNAGTESLEDTGAGGQANRTEGVLQGKAMVLLESKESRTQYTLWMRQKKAIKSRVTISIQTARTELAKETASLGSKTLTSYI